MANSLLIEKQTGGYFKFTLNEDTNNAITSIQNDLLAVGNELHFKTGNGANIIKEQLIYPEDITIVSGGTFTFTTVAQVWAKLIDIDYFAWLGNGSFGSGIDRFDELVDTFKYTGNAGKALIVDNSELKLVPITLHNVSTFTELSDTPDALVPNKMVVVNSAGNALVLQDQPEAPEQFLNSVGYFDYNDLATQTTPLTAVANVALKLTNDTAGANTNTSQNPYGVSYVWNSTTNQFYFGELSVGDTIDIRVHIQVTTTSANQKVNLKAKFGIGSAFQFENSIYSGQFKTAGLNEISFVAPFYIGSALIKDYPAELSLLTDAGASVKVDGWYVRILRKNINIITVDYTVPDATASVKGVVRLGGDLGGTANTPTVPGLANKVSNTRTIGTTSPLTGGGDLSTDLILGIRQANSIDSGYLSSIDWTHFNDSYNHKINSIGVSGTTTKTLTLTQQDGGTLTTSWTDINTDAVTSVFGRTGDVVATNGDYTTSQVTEGTNLYYTNTRVSANTDVAANTAARHNAVTLGTANGLGLIGQALSLGLASDSANGALSSTDWTTFNNKQAALGYIPANDALVMHLSGSETITGSKIFSSTINSKDILINGDNSTIGGYVGLKQYSSSGFGGTGYSSIYALGQTSIYFNTKQTNGSNRIVELSTNLLSNNSTQQYLFPNSSGTFALTSDLHNAVTIGTANGLSLSTQALSLGLASASANGALSSTDWTTFNNKQNALTNPITGFLTSGYLPKATGSTTLGNSLIYDTGESIGIGTSNPTNILSVQGQSQITHKYASGDNISPYPFYFGQFDSSGNTAINNAANADLWIGTNNSEKIRIKPNGNIGIGTTSPSAKLHVLGKGIFDIGSSSGDVLVVDKLSGGNIAFNINGVYSGQIGAVGSGDLYIASKSTYPAIVVKAAGNVGIGTISPQGNLHIGATIINNATYNGQLILKSGNTTAGPQSVNGLEIVQADVNAGYGMKLYTNSSSDQCGIATRHNSATWTERLSISTITGNVGIGTTSPSEKLDVNGTSIIRGTATFQSNVNIVDNNVLNLGSNQGGGATLKYNSNGNLDITPRSGYNTIFTTGNVGIGTTSPLSLLQIGAVASGTTTNSLMYLGGYNTTTSQLRYIMNQNAAGNAGIGTPSSGGILFGYGATDGTITGEWMRITPTGNVGIGTTSPNRALTIVGGNNEQIAITSTTTKCGIALNPSNTTYSPYIGATANDVIVETSGSERIRIKSTGAVNVANLGTGLVYSNGGDLTSTNPSDERLKDNINDLDYGLNEILQLRPVSYDWKDDKINQGKQYGFIAQEVQEVMPELVKEFETKDGEEDVVRLGLDKEGIYAALVNSIKELNDKIKILENK